MMDINENESFTKSNIQKDAGDLDIARKYLTKASHAKQANHEFNLSFTSFKNMIKAKRCYYTGVVLTAKSGKYIKPTDITIDRIDSSKGYVSGNVVACSHWANDVKSRAEDGNIPFDGESLLKLAKKINETKK